MRRPILAVATALALVVVTVGAVTAVGNTWKAPPFSSIGIKNVYFIGADYDIAGANGLDTPILRFFMETGSSSEACLTSLGEGNHTPTVASMFCSARQPAGHDFGVMVTMMLAGPLEMQGDDPAWYSVNVYQEGARMYGTPLRCDLEGC
jgi:hypothetical protein